MVLLTEGQRDRLMRNHAAPDWGALSPVVKLFTPDAAATWLLTTLDPEDGDTLWGLCDLGVGFPELGTVSLAELMSLRGTLVYSGTTDQIAVDSVSCCGCDRDFPPDAFAAVAMGETCPQCDPLSP